MELLNQFGRKMLYNGVANMALNATGLTSYVGSGSYPLKVLKQGSVIYLTNEVIMWMNNDPDSNLVKMDVWEALDDSVFDAIGIVVVDQLELDTLIQNSLPSVGNHVTDNIIYSSVIMSAIQMVGESNMVSTVVKKPVSYLLGRV